MLAALPVRLLLCSLRSVALWLLTFRGRLLHFDLFARVVVADFVARPARDLGATVAIGLEPMIANQRANARRLALDDIECIDARDLRIQLQPACLLNRSSDRCDAAFQLPSTAPVLQPTRRNSACSDRGRSTAFG